MAVDVAPAPLSAVIGGALFLDASTHLRVSTFNSAAGVTLTVTALLMGLDGEVQKIVETHTPNTNRTIAAKTIPMGVGWLLSAQVVASAGTPRRGQCFARLELVNGLGTAFTSLGTILQGYIVDVAARAFPGSPIESSLDGRGIMRSITGTNPAAGVEISETVPTGARWRLWSIVFTFVTAAPGTARSPVITLDDGATVYCRISPVSTQNPAQTAVNVYSGVGAGASVTATAISSAAPFPIDLLPGHRIKTLTNALDPADDYAAPQLCVEEWIEG